jgi:hypothetical protein
MRRWSWLFVVLLAAAVIGGCGDDPDPQDVVAGSADATLDAGSARVHEVIETKGGPQAGRATGDGAFDFHARRGSLTMAAAGQQVEVVVDGGDMYEQIPGLEQEVGTAWLHLDFDQLGEAAGVQDFSALLDSTSSDPTNQLGYLRGAGRVTERGTEDLRGVETTHYHAVIDYDAAAKAAPAKQAKVLRQVKELMGSDVQPVDVWIDGDGRTRRLVETIDFSKVHIPDGADPSALPDEITMTLEYFDFGAKVDVHVPAADDVSELSDLLR